MKKPLSAKPFWFLILALTIVGQFSARAQAPAAPQNLPDAPSAKRPPSFPKAGPAKGPAPDSPQQPPDSSSSSSSTTEPTQQAPEIRPGQQSGEPAENTAAQQPKPQAGEKG